MLVASPRPDGFVALHLPRDPMAGLVVLHVQWDPMAGTAAPCRLQDLMAGMEVAGLHSVAPLVGLAGRLVGTVAPGLLESVVSVVTDGNSALNGAVSPSSLQNGTVH